MKVYQKLSKLFARYLETVHFEANCAPEHKNNARYWKVAATINIQKFCKERLPSGSGFDSGCALDLDASRPNKLVIHFGFHHMNDVGYYVGWTHHLLVIRPVGFHSFSFSIHLNHKSSFGPQRFPLEIDSQGIREYWDETFEYHLSRPVEPDAALE